MRSVFSDDFPIIKTEEQLNELKKKYSNYDSYYVTSGSIEDRRTIFDALYQKYCSYADKNFLIEVKKKFHQRTWEMYLGCVLLDMGIIFSSKDIGPDILIEYEGKKIWIECVACEKGDGIDRVPELLYGKVQNVPTNEMLIRIAGSLKEKHAVYKNYIKKGIINETDQFIIALSRGELSYTDVVIPLILRAVFAIGYPTLSWPAGKGGNGPGKPGWNTIPFIEKKNGSRVYMDFFLQRENEGISAIIYSKDTVLNHSKKLGDDLVIVYNKLAKNPIKSSLFGDFKEYRMNEDGSVLL